MERTVIGARSTNRERDAVSGCRSSVVRPEVYLDLVLPENFQAFAAVLLAIAPGYIATAVWARAKTWKGPSSDFRTVLQSLALSAVVQLLVSPVTLLWIYPVRNDLLAYPGRVFVWLSLTVLIVPVAGGLLAGYLTDRLFPPKHARVEGTFRKRFARIWPAPPPPSVWDWLFTTRPPHGSFVVVEFKDGRRVAGVFAEGSLALTSPEPHGLFLVSEWLLDETGDIVREVADSAGVIIAGTDDIRSLRILKENADG